MIATFYARVRGETIAIALTDSGAVPGGEALLASALRPIPPGHVAPLANVPDAAPMTIAYRAAGAGLPAGWLLTLDAATSATLPAGRYLIDLRVTDASGTVTITSPALVLLSEPATL
ncbi:MAG: hypothetical protein KGK11_07665 [Sphingomonadales bacterium]|nr:hypothetical protein [Sphingomonadales bacterium]